MKAGICIIEENIKIKRRLQLFDLHCGSVINFLEPKQHAWDLVNGDEIEDIISKLKSILYVVGH